MTRWRTFEGGYRTDRLPDLVTRPMRLPEPPNLCRLRIWDRVSPILRTRDFRGFAMASRPLLSQFCPPHRHEDSHLTSIDGT